VRLERLNTKIQLIYLFRSANSEETSRQAFLNIKGRAEKSLLGLMAPASDSYPSLRVYNARPAMVDPPAAAKPPAFPERSTSIAHWGETFLPLLRTFLPKNFFSPGDELAEALVVLASRDGESFEDNFPGVVPGSGGRTLRNKGLRSLVGPK
jgi:hypothetical protein